MIVFDLKCSASHVFEAWFGSSADYDAQRERGLVSCPYCGDAQIEKAVMAPAIAAKGNQRGDAALPRSVEGEGVSNEALDPAAMQAVMKALGEAQAKMLKNSEWVGDSFANRARAMHYGEEEHKSIHGQVAPQEAKALMEEGVKVAPLPLPVVAPEAKN